MLSRCPVHLMPRVSDLGREQWPWTA